MRQSSAAGRCDSLRAGGAQLPFAKLRHSMKSSNKDLRFANPADPQRRIAELESILDSVDDVIWSTTPDGRTLLFNNRAAEALYGRPLSEFYEDEMLWLSAVHPEDRDRTETALRRAAETGEFDVEYRILRADGSVRWVPARARVAADARGTASSSSTAKTCGSSTPMEARSARSATATPSWPA